MARDNYVAPLSQEIEAELSNYFDVEFYRNENYDLDLSNAELFEHFLNIGAYEGRSPNPFFDVSEYLASYRDVLRSGMNPFAHYILHGKQERRVVSQTIRPKQRLAALSGGTEIDWIAQINNSLDGEFYRTQLSLMVPFLSGRVVNYAVHYALLGWKLGLDPSPEFSTNEWIEAHRNLSLLNLAPLLVQHLADNSVEEDAFQVVTEALPEESCETTSEAFLPRSERRAESYSDHNALSIDHQEVSSPHSSGPPARSPQEDRLLESGLFDFQYYLSTYTDVRDAGVDPLYHYVNAGWQEGRNPSSKFSTNFYLTTYPDAKEAEINPLLHYLEKGRALGYMVKSLGGWKIEVLEQSISPEQRQRDYQAYQGRQLKDKDLMEAISKSKGGGKSKVGAKLMLAISHDSYSAVTGGTQMFIADEMNNAITRGFVHLHLAPATPGLTVGDATRSNSLLVTRNGIVLGIATVDQVFGVISQQKKMQVTISIHSLLGFGNGFLESLEPLAAKATTVVWLHDYSLVCNGYNLLRNDVMYCGAPASSSVSCEVCVYGGARAKRYDILRKWLSSISPILASPSEAALQVLTSSKHALPFSKTLVLPHWSLKPGLSRKRSVEGPLRVAFIGYPSAAKGWPLFDEIVNILFESPKLQFFHFVKGGQSPNSAVSAVDCAVTIENRYVTSALLKKHKIDAVMILSPWPETFSYVAAETLIAGCSIVCLEISGNVQALARKYRQGIVFKDEQELMSSIRDSRFQKLLGKATRAQRFHKMQQNNGIFDALAMIEQA